MLLCLSSNVFEEGTQLKRNIKAEVRGRQRANAESNEKQKNRKEVKGNVRKYTRGERRSSNVACDVARHTHDDIVVGKPLGLEFALQRH